MTSQGSLTKAVPVGRQLGNPLHQQVFLVLRERILSRRYGTGEMLPSEDELKRMFNVSRTTVRSALASLTLSGLIDKRQGIGTFVRKAGTTPLLRAGYGFAHSRGRTIHLSASHPVRLHQTAQACSGAVSR